MAPFDGASILSEPSTDSAVLNFENLQSEQVLPRLPGYLIAALQKY
jgi:hypothetical protein